MARQAVAVTPNTDRALQCEPSLAHPPASGEQYLFGRNCHRHRRFLRLAGAEARARHSDMTDMRRPRARPSLGGFLSAGLRRKELSGGKLRSRGRRDAEAHQPDLAGRGIDEHVGRLDILMDEAALVQLAKRGR
jgi:hypothetical protein